MNIYPIPAYSDNYIWAIIDKKLGLFDCVDPGDAEPVVQFAKKNNLKLRAILLTHHHQDHIGGLNQLIRAYPSCFIYGPDDPRIPNVNCIVQEHQTIQVGRCVFKILFNPGHTSSHISYYEAQQELLFCGDTLFSAGCGRVFDGTLEQLHQSLHLFKSLPPTTKIYCAHEYTLQNLRFAQTVDPNNPVIEEHLQKIHKSPHSCTLPSTLEDELLINPFLRTDDPEVQKYALAHGATSKNSLEIFKVLREEKNLFK
ncbi:hydroxyacylglutathione hydrolase [Fluoribacter dumoffii]|uniref:Hydroxyacylglutathione hydrolase n=1 Tax=Fluoribacter dumoffii TaxID=463 RepID=A0A377G9S0_9GAMM|nr:hydroxyacylglutathione hydrolase [Fluoribacter dumoffii]KTC90010.1 hydroxyacylglutathione hydrolase (glyoxalase II) [Fluoribacter dumoffii NY 23]MCW8385308.1 hydroxyacylglutathione hydrolase [Fluoribacter dumoffii]MCW8418362.1 hydroxyacylglutathione hydrolase [Fluoribacter dumoffii]MCW8453796.1 hydroxyacylglutathione hydrolase [Fluoribacter dumoffii]MCW8462133.1 hydroxyacylglutathione hydrolase [Fluoribacter dumoffii]